MKKQQAAQLKEIQKCETDNDRRSETLKEKRKALEVIEHELNQVEKEYRKLTREREYTVNKKLEMMKIKRENEITNESLKLENDMKQEEFNKLKSDVESLKKEIE